MVSAGPTGEVASLAEANEIRIVFSEPMVALGRIPCRGPAALRDDLAGHPGAFRWSGTTILIFTPDAKTPLPFATRYDVTVDASATAVSGRTLGTPYTFGFTTPTVKLLRTETYRRGGRADAPFVVHAALQPAGRTGRCRRAADREVRRRTSGSGRSISQDVQQRLAAIDKTSLEPVQRQGRGDRRCGGLVDGTGDAAAHERLGQEALPAREHARRVRDRDSRAIRRAG